MEQRTFTYFLEIVREQNISRAAKNLYISQPSLSKFLLSLEEELGVSLFDRGRERMSLTPAGKRYLDYVKEAKELRESLLADLQKFQTSAKESIVLGLTPWLGSFITSAIMDQFQKCRSRTEFHIIEDCGFPLFSLFEKHKVDLFTSICPGPGWEPKLRIDSRPILSDRLLLVAPLSHPASRQLLKRFPHAVSPGTPAPADPSLFSGFPVITGKPVQLITRRIESIINAYCMTPSDLIVTQNIDNWLRLSDSGQGIAFIPSLYIRCGTPVQNCAFFSFDSPLSDYTRRIYYDPEHLTPLRLELIHIMEQICSDLLNVPDGAQRAKNLAK